MLNDATLQFSHITKSYGTRRVVDDVTLAVRPGAIIGLVGVNGSGKSTLFKIAAGFVAPAAGSIDVSLGDGRNLSMLGVAPERRAALGLHYQSQDRRFFRGLSVIDNLKICVASLRPVPPVDEIVAGLSDLRLSGLAGKHARDATAADIVKMLLAKAYLLESRFVLIDEPFVELDASDVAHCAAIMLKLRERGAGIVVTDHNAKSILGLVDDVCIMDRGAIAFSGSVTDARSSPEARRLYFGARA